MWNPEVMDDGQWDRADFHQLVTLCPPPKKSYLMEKYVLEESLISLISFFYEINSNRWLGPSRVYGKESTKQGNISINN